jgi:hypothetical protein
MSERRPHAEAAVFFSRLDLFSPDFRQARSVVGVRLVGAENLFA